MLIVHVSCAIGAASSGPAQRVSSGLFRQANPAARPALAPHNTTVEQRLDLRNFEEWQA